MTSDRGDRPAHSVDKDRIPDAGSSPETAVTGEDDGLGPGPNAELVEQVGDVVADRLLADGEALADIRVAQTFRNEGQDLSLAHGERPEGGVLATRRHGHSQKREHSL